MCGIIGYVGSRECKSLLLDGLERLRARLGVGRVSVSGHTRPVPVGRRLNHDRYPASPQVALTSSSQFGANEARVTPTKRADG